AADRSADGRGDQARGRLCVHAQGRGAGGGARARHAHRPAEDRHPLERRGAARARGAGQPDHRRDQVDARQDTARACCRHHGPRHRARRRRLAAPASRRAPAPRDAHAGASRRVAAHLRRRRLRPQPRRVRRNPSLEPRTLPQRPSQVMDIVEVDASTAPDEVLEQIYLVESEASAELLGSAPAPTLAERVARYRNPGTGLRWRWLVHADHEPAGLAELQVHSETFAIGDVLVRPAFRRRGIGRALFDVMCGAAREHSIPSFFGHHGSEAGAGFAAAVGARADLRDVKSVLDLQEAELPAPPVGLELRTWIGPVPDELMETFVAARNAMNDAPTPGGIGDIPWTIERQRDDDATLVARGTPPYTTVVLDGGEVVAFTAVRVQ